MRNFVKITIVFILVIFLSSCGSVDKNGSKPLYEGKKVEHGPELRNPDAKYVGDYENDGLYSKILEIESCTDLDKLTKILKDIYGENFVYTELEYDSKKDIFYPKDSQTPVLPVISAYYKMREDIKAKQTVYLFFQEFDDGQGPVTSDIPTFIMDKYGSYLVEEYEYSTVESTGEEVIYITAWSTLDLYMCERGYIDDTENRDLFSKWVDGMSFFLEFEYLTTDYLQGIGVHVKDEIRGETPSSNENLIEENSNNESLYWTEEEIIDIKKDAGKIILSQEIISLDFINYEQPEDMLNVVHKITGIAKNNSDETISYYSMVLQTDDGAIWNISSAINAKIPPGEEYEVSGLPVLPGVYLTDENKNTSVPVRSQVILSNSKQTNIGYDFSNEEVSLFGRPLETYIGQPK